MWIVFLSLNSKPTEFRNFKWVDFDPFKNLRLPQCWEIEHDHTNYDQDADGQDGPIEHLTSCFIEQHDSSAL